MMIFNLQKIKREYTIICSCCGSYYSPETRLDEYKNGTFNGIGVYTTDKIEPMENEKYRVDVVQTQNGPITFAIRKKW